MALGFFGGGFLCLVLFGGVVVSLAGFFKRQVD